MHLRPLSGCLLLLPLAMPLSARNLPDDSRPAEPAAADRPNILFAFGDDLARYAGIYHAVEGGQTPSAVVRTPNFDRVASEGALFLNAHVCAPSSTPCRSALLSGQYFWRTGLGAILQGAVWNPAIPTFPLLLRDAGYHIGKSCKVWSPGYPADAPYGGQRYAYERRGKRFCRFSQEALRAGGDDPQALAEARRALCEEVKGNFEDFLAARPADTPFCYWWGPTNTHRPWAAGSGHTLWGIDPDDLRGKLPPGLPDTPEVREDFADYLGEVQAFDMALGALIEALDAAGELDRTIIVVSGDHGIPGFPLGKCNLYNLGTRVPLAVRYPPEVAAGRVVEDFVNLMDLAPTFLEAAGETVPEAMTGRSLLPVLRASGSGRIDPARTFVVTGRERHVAAARDGNLPYPQRALTTSRYKYIRNFCPDRWPIGNPEREFPDLDGGPTKEWYLAHYDDPAWRPYMDRAFAKRPYEELYDLASDPGEQHNVADDPRYADVRERLARQLDSVLVATRDPRVVTPGPAAIFDRPPYTDPFEK